MSDGNNLVFKTFYDLQKEQKLKDLKGLKITPEVGEIFEDQDINIRRILRELATCFGTDASINDVATAFEDYNIPKKKIDGVVYIAGYKGSSIIPDGNDITATLIDVKTTKDKVKLMFAVDGYRYIFQSISKNILSVDGAIEYVKSINKKYLITVAHEIIENTGGVHATVIGSEICE